MTSASKIADRALELAGEFLEGSRGEIAALAAGDTNLLYEAAQLVRGRAAAGPHTVNSPEHLAFSLITAAHELLRQEAAGR
jgi:hypothetical protein